MGPFGPTGPTNVNGGYRAPGRAFTPNLNPGVPFQGLPGYLNGKQNAKSKDRQIAANSPPPVNIDPQTKCVIDFLCKCMSVHVINGLLAIQQTARLPSHISPPFSSTSFCRHIGTGSATSPNPPVVLPPVGGGPYSPAAPATLLIDFVNPEGHRGVVNEIGVDFTPSLGGDVSIFATVGPVGPATIGGIPVGRRISPFDTEYGPVPGAADGRWYGFPHGISSPGKFTIHLARGEVFRLFGRNEFPPGPGPLIDTAAMCKGWTYPMSADSGENSIYGTLTDNPKPRGSWEWGSLG
jgi:hypothetical protein